MDQARVLLSKLFSDEHAVCQTNRHGTVVSTHVTETRDYLSHVARSLTKQLPLSAGGGGADDVISKQFTVLPDPPHTVF